MTHRPVKVLVLTSALVWTGVAVYMPALAVVNVDLYHRSAAGFMFLAAPVGVGMLLAAAMFGAFNPRLGSELLIVAGLVLCGLFIGLQMVVPVFGLGVAIALLTGIGAGILLVPLNTLIQRTTADHIRGRVFAVREIVQEFGQVLVSLGIWRMSDPDPWMRPAAGVLALGLIGMAVYGVRWYIMTGPIASRRLNVLWRLSRIYAQAVHHLKSRGRHHVPHRGPVLLVSNHTAGIDPTMIQAALPRPVTWMMAREYKIKGLGWFWNAYKPILVNRKQADPHAARAAIEVLRDGGAIGLFPEGRINRQRQGLLPLSPGVALIATRSDAVIVPVYVTGTPRTEHALLAFLIPSHSRVTYGQPFRLTDEQSRDRDVATQVIRQKMEELIAAEEVANQQVASRKSDAL